MTECTVTCHQCRKDTKPKIWRYLCEDCAREKQTLHRVETGHRPDLYVANEATLDRIMRDFSRAHNLLRGRPPRSNW